MFRIAALAHGLVPIGVPLDAEWQLDVDAMIAALSAHRPNLVFLATPNNPTGNAFRDEDIVRLIQADPGALFVVDEAYGAFAGRTLAGLCNEHPNVAALGTLSKIGLAAARVGWGRLPPVLAVEVDKARQPYNLNALSQAVGLLALGGLAPVLDELVARVVDERERLAAELSALARFTVYPSAANFLLCRHDGDPDPLCADLRARGIAIKSLHAHGGALEHHLRITVGTPDENARLLDALTPR
jgi:histidinol-phosphate aminotransferase